HTRFSRDWSSDVCSSDLPRKPMPRSESFPAALSGPQRARLQPADLTETLDAPAGAGTGYAMAVGDLFQGSIGRGSDVDWLRIDLAAGEDYVFSLWGTGGYYDGMAD